jgi:DNA ligase-4
MTESTFPEKKSKAELEQLIKANGGKIYQTNTAALDTICIAERSMFFVISGFEICSSERTNICRRNGQGGIFAESRRYQHYQTILVN